MSERAQLKLRTKKIKTVQSFPSLERLHGKVEEGLFLDAVFEETSSKPLKRSPFPKRKQDFLLFYKDLDDHLNR